LYRFVEMKHLPSILFILNSVLVFNENTGTSTHIFRLEKTHPVFEQDPLIVRSIKVSVLGVYAFLYFGIQYR
jgi:hypothetical protein